ncbi:N/A [soil metagenome]
MQTPVESELQKLKIDKSHKARRDERSVWPWILVALLLVGIGVAVWQWSAHSTVASVSVIRVTVPDGGSASGDLVALNATGYIMAAHKIELAAKVIGRVEWVGVEMGDKIQKGQVLVRLEQDEYKARVATQQGELDNAKARLAELEAGMRPQEIAQAAAAVAQAAANLANAVRNNNRILELKNNTVSQQEIDDAATLVKFRTAEVESAKQAFDMAKIGPRKEQIDAQRATVRQLEGSLASANVELQNTIITSPISGTVLARNVEQGEFVTNAFVGENGAKGYVVSIADLNDLRVELDISQNDFAKIGPKQPCWITTDAYPDKKYAGIVDLISPEANRQKATVMVRVKVLNPDELLKPDMNATVSFLSAKADATSQPVAERPAIRVPPTAIRNGSVFVVENGKALARQVTVGQTTTGGEVEIRKGLIGGEDLIDAPPETLKDGDRVSVK